MSKNYKCIIARNVPLRLTMEQMEWPEKVVSSFFKEFDLEDCRRFLWLGVSSAVCLSDDDLGTEISRNDLLAYWEEFERAIEAFYLISVRNDEKDQGNGNA